MCRRKVFLTLFFLSLSSLCVYAQQADKGKDYRTTPITIKVSGEPLSNVLNMVSKQANIKLRFTKTIEQIGSPVTVNFKNEPLNNVLEYLLKSQGVKLNYGSDRTVEIDVVGGIRPQSDLCKVTGFVYDELDKPLSGATILIKDGTSGNKGAITDNNGYFELNVPRKSAIKISFIGYEAINKYVTRPTHMKITLTPNVNNLDEVIVTGMGTKNKHSFTGNYVTVKGDELKRISPNNLLKALQFYDPSFHIIENNSTGSDPNSTMNFQIRGDVALGNTSVNNMDLLLNDISSRPNVPLFVLDGFIVGINRITELDPERVESMTILKDAAATAIYGSKAANGVILVETKTTLDGDLNVSYAMNMGIDIPDLTDYNLLDAKGKLELEWKAGLYDVNNVEQMNEYNRYKREVLAGVNTYWLSQPLRTALTQRHSLSLGGGTEAFRYTLAVNVASTLGVMKGSDRGTQSVNYGMQYRKGKWNIGANVNVTNTNGNNSPYGSFSLYTKVNPYYRLRDADGNYLKILDHKFVGSGNMMETITNPLYNTQFKSKDFNKSLNVANNVNIEFAPLENLRFSAALSYNRGTARTEVFKSASNTAFADEDDLTKRGSYTKNNGESSSWSVNLSGNYNLMLKKHRLSFTANWTVDETKSDYVNLSATGYPDENMTDFLFGNKMSDRVSGSESTNRSMGFTGQISYSYDMRYSFDFNLRGDISSQFGSDNRFAPFWSAGIRWNAHQESWLKGKIPNLVFRASYGLTGSQNYSPYQAIEFYSYGNLMFPYTSSGVLGAELMGIGNNDLGWSKTKNFNFAVDMGLLQNRLNLTFNYYNTLTEQLLVDFTLPPSTGFNSRTFNAGKLENKGYDITLSAMPYVNMAKRIQWNITASANHNANKIKKISNALKTQNEQQLATAGAPLPVYQEGQSTTTLYLVPSLGIDPMNGKEVFETRDGERTYVWNAADKVPVGDTNPKLSGSLSTTFNYQDFSVMLGAQYQLHAKTYNSTLVDKIENSNIAYNMDKRALTDRWTTPGVPARYKGYSLTGNSTPQSTRFLMTLNELRFSTISISYRLRAERARFLKKLGIRNVNMTFSTQDIARLSTVKQERGLDYPFSRSYNLSLSVLFR